jgi:hypothetical protein
MQLFPGDAGDILQCMKRKEKNTKPYLHEMTVEALCQQYWENKVLLERWQNDRDRAIAQSLCWDAEAELEFRLGSSNGARGELF